MMSNYPVYSVGRVNTTNYEVIDLSTIYLSASANSDKWNVGFLILKYHTLPGIEPGSPTWGSDMIATRPLGWQVINLYNHIFKHCVACCGRGFESHFWQLFYNFSMLVFILYLHPNILYTSKNRSHLFKYCKI